MKPVCKNLSFPNFHPKFISLHSTIYTLKHIFGHEHFIWEYVPESWHEATRKTKETMAKIKERCMSVVMLRVPGPVITYLSACVEYPRNHIFREDNWNIFMSEPSPPAWQSLHGCVMPAMWVSTKLRETLRQKRDETYSPCSRRGAVSKCGSIHHLCLRN